MSVDEKSVEQFQNRFTIIAKSWHTILGVAVNNF
jgi:hypothetical protein